VLEVFALKYSQGIENWPMSEGANHDAMQNISSMFIMLSAPPDAVDFQL
jgi:hypothetical protein